MANPEVPIEDALYTLLESNLPGAVDPEEWLSLQCEQAITEQHLQEKAQGLQQQAQQGGQGLPAGIEDMAALQEDEGAEEDPAPADD